MTPTAEMAAYCLDEPLRAYETGAADGVGWALVDNQLVLHLSEAETVTIPAGQESCGQDWRLLEFAGNIPPSLSQSYAVMPEDAAARGFVLGFPAGSEIRARADLLRQCAASQEAGSEPAPGCESAAVTIGFGPATSPRMELRWTEDPRLADALDL